jgi:hypothetical protein
LNLVAAGVTRLNREVPSLTIEAPSQNDDPPSLTRGVLNLTDDSPRLTVEVKSLKNEVPNLTVEVKRVNRKARNIIIFNGLGIFRLIFRCFFKIRLDALGQLAWSAMA